ncbi:alpha-beta hydrolase superfamily lysophospholipase [Deinococcus humi]|uniref:Alpha-beta hydrolase superfamily lysophospholipase n=1 Tax=Deinococcus humi TaxID=662880 RepID=A0A7W8JZD4_9DEIO|nr:alpha-beta hydrolase superfamily lysophospholipase [Deinococcus humi]
MSSRGRIRRTRAEGYATLFVRSESAREWGSPAEMQEAERDQGLAVRHFARNGRSYAVGVSMGGLMALRSAESSAVYRVRGVVLIDGWTKLQVPSAARPRSAEPTIWRPATPPRPNCLSRPSRCWRCGAPTTH